MSTTTKGLSVKYYNAATTNIPISRNFRFLSPVETITPEEIAFEPGAPLEGQHGPPCEGERRNGTRSAASRNRPENSGKRKVGKHIEPGEPQKTRRIRVDYKS
jgi:hypothetical protein